MTAIKYIATAILTLLLLGACDQGPAESTGENIDEATEETGESLEEAGEEAQEPFE